MGPGVLYIVMTLPAPARRVAVAVLLLATAACSMHIETPSIDPMNPEPVLSQSRQAKLSLIALNDNEPPLPTVEELRIPPIDPDVQLPRAGETTAFGLPVTPELEQLWRASLDKDWQYWEAQLQEVEA